MQIMRDRNRQLYGCYPYATSDTQGLYGALVYARYAAAYGYDPYAAVYGCSNLFAAGSPQDPYPGYSLHWYAAARAPLGSGPKTVSGVEP